MPLLTVVRGSDLVKVLQRAGFVVVRQRGGHVRLEHPDGRAVTVPVHARQDVGRGLLRKILRDAELSGDLLNLL
ncbi:MAG: type II toxin-antitoxin system HicA family toxin [Anaerolineae bacterium]|nr:type II toxin-antitoxin system HicA family toxin [Anaerolineae bacterium]